MKNYPKTTNVQHLQNEIAVLNNRYEEYIKQTGKFPELKAIRIQLREIKNVLNKLMIIT